MAVEICLSKLLQNFISSKDSIYYQVLPPFIAQGNIWQQISIVIL